MREWLVTNGLGGYASLTYNNTNTSKYHGLLVASLNPPTKRWVFISNILDRIKVDGQDIYLSDYKPIFNFDYFPSFTYNFDDFKIKKTIFMEHEKNTTCIKYDIETKKPISLIHQPVVNSRHIYDVTKDRYLDFEQCYFKDVLTIKPSNTSYVSKIFLKNAKYEKSPYWEVLYYNKDHKRGDSWIDNNLRIGKFYKEINKKTQYFLTLTIENEKTILPSKVYSIELERRKKLFEDTNLNKKFKKLILSSDNFIVKKEEGKSVIAGYPWFSDWGRDTLISLPGLTLVTHRFNEAKDILENFSRYCKNGLIPNVFDDRNSEPFYNTVDASLWYIDRVYQYMKYTDDEDFLEKNWEILDSIINGYKNGTDFDIKMDDDFLIKHGPGLTWMDVKIDDFYPTPRSEKAVEIQALWYNALRIMSQLSNKLDRKDIYFDLSESVKESFQKKYDKLYDVIDRRDNSFRSNIIFLVSLDFTMIDLKLQKDIVERIQDKLLTIFGLRTLSPDNRNYKKSLIGDYNKDLAYHNGIVWPWLLGSFIKAYIKINKNKPKFRRKAYDDFLKPMLQVYGELWDGSIHEIFDAEPIFEPRGCISQAWSVAEILRTWVEDIENIKPKSKNSLLNKISV